MLIIPPSPYYFYFYNIIILNIVLITVITVMEIYWGHIIYTLLWILSVIIRNEK